MWSLLEHVVGVHAHGAQFESVEFSFESHHATTIDDRPAIVDFDRQRSQNDERRKQDQQQKGAKYVQSVLDGALPGADGTSRLIGLCLRMFGSGGQQFGSISNHPAGRDRDRCWLTNQVISAWLVNNNPNLNKLGRRCNATSLRQNPLGPSFRKWGPLSSLEAS